MHVLIREVSLILRSVLQCYISKLDLCEHPILIFFLCGPTVSHVEVEDLHSKSFLVLCPLNRD